MSFSDTFKQIVATVAPVIGTAFGGPLGGLAGNFLASKLGTPAGDQKALEAKVLSNDPQIMLQVKAADEAFQAHLADLGVQEDQLAASDTANARAREIALRDNTTKILAVGVVFVTFLLEGSLLMGWHQPAQVSGEILGRILGTLDSATILVLSYYFGSSSAAKTKDDTINTLAKS